MDTHHISTPCTDESFQEATTEEEDFSTAQLDDDIWLEDPVPDKTLMYSQAVTTALPMYSQAVTTALPVFLSLLIQLGPTTFHSRRYTSIILQADGPQ